MTWLPLLLGHPSPCFRYRVLTQLLGRDDGDLEVEELARLREEDPLLLELAALQHKNGSWTTLSSKLPPRGQPNAVTALALTRLGMLGFGSEHIAVEKGASYLLRQQQKDGSWPLSVANEESGEYTHVSLQTSIPLQGLAAAGYADDPQCKAAYRWLLSHRLPDGAWPSGLIGDVHGYVAGYRRMPHSRWGCRTNTTSALICLSRHPELRSSPEARKALDLLLGRETRETRDFGFEIARLMGAAPSGGFFTFHRHFDLVLMLQLCSRIGADTDDPRVASLVAFIEAQQNSRGLWIPPSYPPMAHWVTLELLQALDGLDRKSGWISSEPRTPFAPYPSRRKRY